jgi:MerR family transcriptional regulator, light-induced transcriptional regulator
MIVQMRKEERDGGTAMGERTQGIYNMRAVCQKLGLTPETLRAWERRYEIVTPSRNEAGHRLYSEEDLQTLAWLVEQIQQGFTIGQAVQIYKQKEGQAGPDPEGEGPEQGAVPDASESQGYRETLHQFRHAILHWDRHAAEQTLEFVCALFGVELFAGEWIPSLLERMGNSVKTGEWRLAHERFACQVLRQQMYALMRVLPLSGAGTEQEKGRGRRGPWMALPAEGEPNDLPLLAFSLFLRYRGEDVTVLYPGLPDEDVRDLIQEIGPQTIVFSFTRQGRVYRKGEWEERTARLDALLRLVGEASGDTAKVLLSDAYVPHPRQLKEWGISLIRNRKEEWERLLENAREEERASD